MIKTNRSKYFPTCEMDGRHNYKRVFRIEKDASVTERIFLDVPDPTRRELLICLHYLKHITRFFLGERVGVNILSRDNPWDFKLQLSTGRIFNLEITSVADGPQHFELNKREERLAKWGMVPSIPLHQLEKLNSLFPNKEIEKDILKHKANGVTANELVDNPLQSNQMRIMLSNLFEPVDTLENQLKLAVSKKLKKNHSEKHLTVLIVDNRTSAFDVQDYFAATEVLESFIEATPFPEVWFYTGYCSDNDGNNAEFSFSPLKTTPDQRIVLEKLTESGEIDENGRFIW